ncbi:alpha/beta hydrolase [Desertifilum sp. FACHB-1129]|uniref:Alpha/beta hydrolase n=1 Tax=Desertifilum tharense IPPAS B-1220 TaxID=1781255 RepID=A0A1E5QJG9_9CYAN|nr:MULTISPECIES: alpha/beta hydrolase [Desertifilum]MDA0211558.1 alpha/beta hydrolase [Cyanobacteria bacterium FC1]MBD2310082.1 alpha/beta hydrolase [Desertifilum sp. FACHB-1129]MBD2322114.1 alpha/beta hydrolase [Desertifilum sp. FACHB-866]MBD2333807.1 alpha/beta hydrolase [Desertifilum sp. FACHB-868]OEJ74768.1 alpha/beta hydrolase [Desertifilum tharense IPPAS B-1220]
MLKHQRLKRWIIGDFSVKRLIRSALAIYAVVCVYAWGFSDRQIFLPPPSSYSDHPGIIKLASAPEVQISATYLPNPQADYTLLYSHGNAEDLGQIQPVLVYLRSLGFSVFAYDYRRYGTSQGTPTEQGVYADITAAYRYLTEALNIPSNRIIAHGRSIGSGPAVELASRYRVGGVILENPLTSAFRVVTRIPILPFDKFNNLQKISQIRSPIAILHGTEDRTIPFSHGQQLYAAANEPKFFIPIEGGEHNDLMGEQYDRAIQDFRRYLSDRANLVSGRPLSGRI